MICSVNDTDSALLNEIDKRKKTHDVPVKLKRKGKSIINLNEGSLIVGN